MNTLMPMETIEKKIFLIRGKKVMLDRDLADLYKIETAQLKRQIKRNIDRFPSDFMFILNQQEVEMMVCQNGIPSKKHFGGAKPYVFTEHGILMLSSVLNSKRAIQVNIQIMRIFNKLRQLLLRHEHLNKKIEELEQKYDKQFKIVFDALREIIMPPEKPKKKIGFIVNSKP
ncbi:MAG: ORF6N domain-containing protein [Candidatus Margulisbacteria bacterium]|nr:ORF6N domain-containing protein [Candidatus Margulisiibacteriota bacterium]MBU1021891.1 ORF6N domain-containing protein [Candidatus Margulisiibacteriota bacterium]MBU1728529.1 ORF6N domain-containing protein [Candidatus Margulisiibacteriota bacterium]MBU1954676.1 ORF6N domain-containing protein [Candidatus Margulisiibacteriota bacterium]